MHGGFPLQAEVIKTMELLIRSVISVFLCHLSVNILINRSHYADWLVCGDRGCSWQARVTTEYEDQSISIVVDNFVN